MFLVPLSEVKHGGVREEDGRNYGLVTNFKIFTSERTYVTVFYIPITKSILDGDNRKDH